MASTSKTLQEAILHLNLNNDDAATTTYNTAGVAPQEILSNVVSRTYNIVGMTPAEFNKEHGSTVMDFDDIKVDFKKICLDYGNKVKLEEPSKAVEFCSRMIYEVGPEARQVRKQHGDKTWKFIFMYNANNRLECKVAFVSTYKTDTAKYNRVPVGATNKITLSVKHATLLALETLQLLNVISAAQTPPIYLMTPLAGAIFSREDIPKISEDLNIGTDVVINIINCSCQSGGQYLGSSRMHVAAVASIVATRNVKDTKIRDGIIGKTLKQYLNMGKIWNLDSFEVYARYGHGGVPSSISPKNLINALEALQRISPLAAGRASSQTLMQTYHSVPDMSQRYGGQSDA